MKSLFAALTLVAATASAQSINGQMWLEQVDDAHVAVMISTTPGSAGPQSFAFKLVLSRDAVTVIDKGSDVANCAPVFSWSNNVSDVVVLNANSCPLLGGSTYEVARVNVTLLGPWPLTIDFEPSVSILSDQGGRITATTAKGNLRLAGITLDATRRRTAAH